MNRKIAALANHAKFMQPLVNYQAKRVTKFHIFWTVRSGRDYSLLFLSRQFLTLNYFTRISDSCRQHSGNGTPDASTLSFIPGDLHL